MREDYKREIYQKYYNTPEGPSWDDLSEAHQEVCIKECELQIENLTKLLKDYPYDFRRLICFANDMITLLKSNPEIRKQVGNFGEYDSFRLFIDIPKHLDQK
jgi:hypothetical protein